MNTLKAEKRSMDVKAKKLRREGFVTGNLFGREIEGSIPLKFTKKEIEVLLKNNNKGSQVMLELEGKTYLCFGGAESQDKDDREPGVNWWKQEMPSDEEYDTCRRNLEKVDYKVDYVLTHDAPSRFLDFTALALGESNRLHLFLDEILLKLTYEKWFFGCYHKDVQLSTKSRCVFCDVIPMGERRTGLFR